MATPSTTSDWPIERPSSANGRSSPMAGIRHVLTHGISHGQNPAIETRDAIARGILRTAVLALEVVALAFLIAGSLGVLQQLAAADSFGLSLLVPVLAVVLVAGFCALMCLAAAATVLVLLRVNHEIELMKSTVDVADRQPPLAGEAKKDGAVAA